MTFNKVRDRVYVRDERFEWLPATIRKIDNDRIQVEIVIPDTWKDSTVLADPNEEFPRKERRWVDLKDYYNHCLPPQSIRNCRDLADLEHLHEAAILYTLKQRHFECQPYTRVGEIIVAVNPCQWIHSLYTKEEQQFYIHKFANGSQNDDEEKKEGEAGAHQGHNYDNLGCEPHIYEVSAQAYHGLCADRQNQAIVVSGESGAGKTESIKIVLRHLVTLQQTMSPSSSVDEELLQHILESSPIFEAFGNAKTFHNDNSSRFGKITQLQYEVNTNGAQLVGTAFETYMLETGRVVKHTKGDRNYHIFYQILSNPKEVKRVLLGPDWMNAIPDDFRYLNQYDRCERMAMDDLNTWKQTSKALNHFGWTEISLKLLVRGLGIVLLLGNIVFDEKEEGEAIIANRGDLNLLALSLEVSVEELEFSLTQRVIETTQEMLSVPHSASQAKDACDALAKAIYAGIFASVVRQINVLTSAPPVITGKHYVISLVDIFGFESFDINRFEQLCINYANEKLHQKYVLDNLSRHKMEYDAEGIELQNWKDIENSKTLDLFEGHMGLIDSLNEQCTRPNGSSEVFVFRIRDSCKGNQRFIHNKLQRRTEFGIVHYAGPVCYDASDFVERNTDKLSDALLHIAASSSNALIAQELGTLINSRSGNRSTDTRNSKNTRRTSMEKFKKQLHELLSSIEDSQTRYIRCIKPCEDLKIKQRIDHQGVLRQLKCAGLIAAIELSRETFPNKLPFETIESRYTCLLTKDQAQCLKDMESHDRAQFIMSILFSPIIEQFGESEFAMPFACGKTKVFFRAGALESLEIFRRAYFNSASTVIQKHHRMFSTRSKYLKQLMMIIQIQSLHRMRKQYKHFNFVKENINILQAWIRMNQKRKYYLRKKLSAKVLERWLIVFLTRIRFVQMRKASIILTSWFRMIREKVQYQRTISSAIIIESFIRSAKHKIEYSNYRASALVIGWWWRTLFLRNYHTKLKLSVTSVAAYWRGYLQRQRYLKFKQAITLLQAKFRAQKASLEYKKERDAALRIIRWIKILLARQSYKRSCCAANVLAQWGRSRVARIEFCRKREASISVQSWYRSVLCVNSYRRLRKAAKVVDRRWWLISRMREERDRRAAVKIQTMYRRHIVLVSFLKKKKALWIISRFFCCQLNIRRSRKLAESTAAKKLQATFRMYRAANQFDKRLKAGRTIRRWLAGRLEYLRNHRRNSWNSAILIQTRFRTFLAVKAFEKRRMIATRIDKWQVRSQVVKSPRSLESSINYGEAYDSEDSIEVQLKDGSSIFDEKDVLADCVIVPKSMIQEKEYYKKQVEQLQKDMAQLVAETALHNQDVEAEFDERLAEYEEEVLQLKQTIARFEDEKLTLLDELAANVKNVQSLKSGLCSMQESHREYLKKVMKAVENANAEHVKAIQKVKHERDAKINALEAEIESLKEKPEYLDKSVGMMDQEIYRLARKLEKIIAPDNIAAVADIARMTSVCSVDYIEEALSSKARKLLYRLEDAAFAAASVSEAVSRNPMVDFNEVRQIDESCVQGLQQQLVIAYEEIERLQRLQNEDSRRTARSLSERKRRPDLQKYSLLHMKN